MHCLNSVSLIQTRCYETGHYTDYSTERRANKAHSPGQLALGPLGRARKDDVMMGLYMEICWRRCWMRVWLGRSTSHGPARKPLCTLLHKLHLSHRSRLSVLQHPYQDIYLLPWLRQLVHGVHQRQSSPPVFLLFSKQARPMQG